MNKTRGLLVAGAVAALTLFPQRAGAQDCGRAVVFTLPAVTWEEVVRVRPPNLLELVETGSAGSVSVRTVSARTSYAAGFATIGAGSRVDVPRAAGSSAAGEVTAATETDLRVSAVEVLARLADDTGYQAAPGAMTSVLQEGTAAAVGNADPGLPPPTPAGYGRWTALAAMDEQGVVDRAAVGPDLLVAEEDAPFGVRTQNEALGRELKDAVDEPCSLTVVDQGDLARADEWAVVTNDEQPAARARALVAADEMLGLVMSALDEESDLLLVVSPTSPWWDREVHLGVAVARGPGFEPDTTLSSASTRRAGVVTLPDVAPTILDFRGKAVPARMIGKPWFDRAAGEERVADAVAFDRESIFVENMKGPVSVGFVITQVLVYLLAMFVFRRGKDSGDPGRLARLAEIAVLAMVAFPVSTYATGAFDGHSLGVPGFVAVLIGLNALLVVVAVLALKDPLDRLLLLTAATAAVFYGDLLTGARLQINTVLGYSPVVAGRFAGLGNIGFAVLGATSLLTGVLIANRWRDRLWALPVAAVLYGATVVVVGGAPWGSDVGGILALVPSFVLTWLLLSGRRPNLRVVAAAGAAALLAVALFLAFDLSRPDEQQTHLARLFEDVRERGGTVFWDTIQRKAQANIRLFRSSIWTYLVPPALVAMAFLTRRPRGRWQEVATSYPRLRAGLTGGLILGVIGFAVNDSGIVIPAVILSFLVPTAVLTHLKLNGPSPRPEAGPS